MDDLPRLLPIDAQPPETARSLRRTRLREFQTQLIERMRIARSGSAQTVSQLGVMAGPVRWLIDLRQAGEIVAPGMFVPVPLTQDWFIGLMNVRGNLISVIDFARFQGLARTPVDKSSRVIGFGPQLAPHSGLLVSRVLGLRSSAGMSLQAPMTDAATVWSAAAFLDQDAQPWIELDLARLAQDARFLDISS